jgi:hypothetical protein
MPDIIGGNALPASLIEHKRLLRLLMVRWGREDGFVHRYCPGLNGVPVRNGKPGNQSPEAVFRSCQVDGHPARTERIRAQGERGLSELSHYRDRHALGMHRKGPQRLAVGINFEGPSSTPWASSRPLPR